MKFLIVGASAAEIRSLGDAATALLGEGVALSLETGPHRTDTKLAWGTKRLRVHQLVRPASAQTSTAVEQPLSADGDIWKTAVDAAHRNGVDVIIVGGDEMSRMRRLFFGSAVHDLVVHADLPVLALPKAPRARALPASRRPT